MVEFLYTLNYNKVDDSDVIVPLVLTSRGKNDEGLTIIDIDFSTDQIKSPSGELAALLPKFKDMTKFTFAIEFPPEVEIMQGSLFDKILAIVPEGEESEEFATIMRRENDGMDEIYLNLWPHISSDMVIWITKYNPLAIAKTRWERVYLDLNSSGKLIEISSMRYDAEKVIIGDLNDPMSCPEIIIPYAIPLTPSEHILCNYDNPHKRITDRLASSNHLVERKIGKVSYYLIRDKDIVLLPKFSVHHAMLQDTITPMMIVVSRLRDDILPQANKMLLDAISSGKVLDFIRAFEFAFNYIDPMEFDKESLRVPVVPF